jgi:predicted acyl esterase
VGDIELRLDASLSTTDGGWLVTLLDVAEDGRARTITAGWLRASLRTVDDAASRYGAPVLPCRDAVAVAPDELVSYRIPLVPNAFRFVAGHRIGLVLTSDDRAPSAPTILGFRHQPIEPASRVSVRSSSRLILPVLP